MVLLIVLLIEKFIELSLFGALANFLKSESSETLTSLTGVQDVFCSVSVRLLFYLT